MKKEIKNNKIRKNYISNSPSRVGNLRAEWLKKGVELIDIMGLCEAKIGNSGWCNNFNEPDENCYHVKINYRGDCIASFDGDNFYVIDDDLYLLFIDDEDFMIFRKVKLGKLEKK